MSQARLMDGTALARRIVEETGERATVLTERTGTAPCLATVLVGEDPASVTYVRIRQNRGRKAGVTSRHAALSAATTTGELVATIEALSADPGVHGILLQRVYRALRARLLAGLLLGVALLMAVDLVVPASA